MCAIVVPTIGWTCDASRVASVGRLHRATAERHWPFQDNLPRRDSGLTWVTIEARVFARASFQEILAGLCQAAGRWYGAAC